MRVLKYLRITNQQSQQEAADAIGIKRWKLSLTERGYKILTDDEIDMINNYYNVCEDLLPWEQINVNLQMEIQE